MVKYFRGGEYSLSIDPWALASALYHCIKRKPRPVVGASLLLLTALLTGVLIKVPPPGKLNVAVEGPGERRAKKILGKAKIVRTLIDIGAEISEEIETAADADVFARLRWE